MTLTSRENYKRILDHKLPEWIPDFKKESVGGPISILEERAPGDGTPAQVFGGTGKDWFGVNWVYEPTVRASMVDPKYPFVMNDITKWNEIIKFPNLDKIDWKGWNEKNHPFEDPDKLHFVTILNGLFERLHALMGMTEANCALIEEPEAVYEFFGALTDYKIKLIDKLVTNFDIDFIEFHDDWGHGRGTFFSPKTWDDLIGPHMKRIADFTKSKGVYFGVHSCGKMESLVPNMLACGIEHWTSCQGMNDIEQLVKTYGGQLTMLGGMDIPEYRSSSMTLEKLTELAGERIDLLCKGGCFVPFGSSSVPNLSDAVGRALEMRKDYFQKPENQKYPRN